MNSLKNILDYINRTTEEEIEKIRKENVSKCKEILENLDNSVKKQKKEIEKKIIEKKEQINKNFEIEMKQYKNKIVANKKNEILKKIIEFSIYSFCNENDNIYINFIEKLIIKNIPKEESFILIFGENDYKKFIDIFNSYDNIRKIEASKEFKYGFKIVCNKYILNFDVENMFTENIEKLKLKAYSAVFLEDI